MKKLIFLGALLCSIALMGSQARADVTIDFVPSSQTVKVGGEVVVHLHVSDLGALGDPPAVSWFDVDVLYWDPNEILKFESAIFTEYLGDPSDPNETTVNVVEYEGFVWVAETSKLSANELLWRQAWRATLVTLRFKAKKAGSTSIDGDLYGVKDENGQYLIWPQGLVGSAKVTVVKGNKALPPSFP